MKNLSAHSLCYLLTFSLLLQTLGPVTAAAIDTDTVTEGVFRIVTPDERVIGPDGTTGSLSFEVTSTTLSGANGAQAARAVVAQLLSERPSETPPQVVVLVDPDQPPSTGTQSLVDLIPEAPGVIKELPRGWISALKKRFYKWYSVPRNHQITLSLTQLVYEGAAISTTLVMGEGIAIGAALPMGVLLGGISAAFTYKNSQWRQLLLGSRLTRAFFGYPEGKVPASLQQAEAFGVWLLTDMAVVTVAMATMWALGIPFGHDRTVAQAFAYSLLWDIGTEYTWDLAINTTNVRLKTSWIDGDHEKIDRRTTTALWMLSGVAAAGMVAQLMQLPYYELILGTITAAGALSFAGALSISAKKTSVGPLRRVSNWLSSCAVRLFGEGAPRL